MLLVSEIFDLVEKEPSKEGKIFLLRKHQLPILKAILHMNYEGSVNFMLPEGTPPFKKEIDTPIGYEKTTLNMELKRLYIWLQPNINISRLKKESLFIEMLEGLHHTEADIICLAKDKILHSKYPSLTMDLTKEAFPDIVYTQPIVKELEKPKKSRTKKSSKQLEVTS